MKLKFIPVGIVAALSIFSAPAVAGSATDQICGIGRNMTVSSIRVYQSGLKMMDSAVKAYTMDGDLTQEEAADIFQMRASAKRDRAISLRQALNTAAACQDPSVLSLTREVLATIDQAPSPLTQKLLAMP
ncbi:MAG: hypothetical protein KME35_05010 [Aphanocapsa sp. GSE-SYN-MK-11-07L]|jgi:hypothetical protein|nr:hypothetical protein [Aphanocapsa sp. GSE-SYN-MK-11-07L]